MTPAEVYFCFGVLAVICVGFPILVFAVIVQSSKIDVLRKRVSDLEAAASPVDLDDWIDEFTGHMTPSTPPGEFAKAMNSIHGGDTRGLPNRLGDEDMAEVAASVIAEIDEDLAG